MCVEGLFVEVVEVDVSDVWGDVVSKVAFYLAIAFGFECGFFAFQIAGDVFVECWCGVGGFAVCAGEVGLVVLVASLDGLGAGLSGSGDAVSLAVAWGQFDAGEPDGFPA